MESTMKAKRCAAIGLGVAMLVAVLAIGSVQSAYAADDGGSSGVAPAANTADTGFAFRFASSGSTYQGDEPRRKDNATSVYVGVKTKTLDRCKAYVDGGSSSSGPWVNKTLKGKATISKLGNFAIQTYVNEHGYKYARLTGWADSQPGVVSGVWSPDSAGTYTAING